LENFTVALKAGPYLAYGLSAKMEGKLRGHSVDYDLYKKGEIYSDKAMAKRFDYGLGIGADLELGKLVIGLVYEYGFANINNAGSGENAIYNQNAMLSIGYKF
jgi:hypothetical protein